MKRPSFQFYPGDWQVNSNLRRCTHAERGAWLDVMCLMHDQEEYGVLRWPLKEIAKSIGAPLSLLRGLVTKGVLKGSDSELTEGFIYTPRSGRKDGEPVTLVEAQPGPVWYSSRMVKDEHVRTMRGESSRFGADDGEAPKATSKVAPKPPFGDGSSSSSSSSPSVNTSLSEEAKASSSSPGGDRTGGEDQGDKAPPCPYDAIVIAYHEALPSLPRVKLMNDKRKRAMKAFWGWVFTSRRADGQRRATTAQEALDWVEAYFERAGRNDFLMGRAPGRGHENWLADFDFLLTERGKTHVLEKTDKYLEAQQ